MTDIVKQCLQEPPVDTTYKFGIWHPGRLNWKGFVTEARIHASYLTKPKNADVRKFIIICRARSGSTLLTHLLGQHPDITCDKEVLAYNVLSPQLLLDRLAKKTCTPVYGCKLLSYQMIQVHRMAAPRKFLKYLKNDGFRIIHLERNTFYQTLSMYEAQQSGLYHLPLTQDAIKPEHSTNSSVRSSRKINAADFVKRLRWSEMMLKYEREIVSEFSDTYIHYESDLQNTEAQKELAVKLYKLLGIEEFHPNVKMKKLANQSIFQRIKNFEEVAEAIKKAGLSHLLPDDNSS